jgi:tripartite-type tricarboxylate transporter receptor subunit TctC
LLCAIFAWFAPTLVAAQTDGYPNKAITLIIPFAPGGAIDNAGRLVGEQLSKVLKQPVVVENKPGANGAIGMAHVLNRPADGYTLVMNGASKTVLKTLQPSMAFDPMKDLLPVSMVAKVPLVLVVSARTGIKDFAGFKDYLSKNPNKVAWGVAGVGTGPHLAGTALFRDMKADPITVQYGGSALIHSDLIAGRVHVAMDSIGPIMPHITSGTVVPVATLSQTREKALPNIPTLAELGFSDFNEVRYEAWNSIDVPAKTPDAIVQVLNRAMAEVLENPELQTRIERVGMSAFKPMSFKDTLDFTVKVSARLTPLAAELAKLAPK